MKNLFTVIFVMLMLNRAEAQLVAWNLSGATGNETTQVSNVGNGNMEISTLKRGSGVTAAAANSAFSSTWPQIAVQTQNCYYEFTVKAKEGYKVSLSSIDVKLRVQTNGPKTYIWKYSLDGGENFTDIGTPYTLTTGNFDFSNNDGIQQPTLDISGICALQNLPSSLPVVFRIYAWNSGNATSAFRIGRTLSTSEHVLVIDGSVVNAIPPVVAWNFVDAVGDESTSISNINHANVMTSVLSRGSAVIPSAAGDSYASVWPLITNENQNCYYEFTVKAQDGYSLSLANIDAKLRIQNNGPKTYIWKYSLDSGTNFINIGTPYTWTSSIDLNNNDGVHQPGVSLSGIPVLQHIPSNQSVVFRIYAWNSGNATSGFRLGKSLSASENALVLSGTVNATTTPVKLLSFKGKPEGNSIRLNWTTASELNNSRFEILRFGDSRQSISIGKVNGGGTVNAIRHYTLLDTKPLAGINYYQLKQVDFNGNSEKSDIISVRTDLDKPYMRLVASATGVTAYIYDVTVGEAVLSIIDITGKPIWKSTLVINRNTEVVNIPLNDNKSMYIASLVDKDGKRFSVKFSR